MSKLLIIDTYGLIFRAYHAYPMLTTADGKPTNAIFGFTQMLLSTIEKQQPTHLVCSLESSTPTFRHELAHDYKANRKPATPEIKEQIGEIIDILATLNIQTLKKDGYEADDVIGSFSCQMKDTFEEIKILTGDRDLFQLLKDNVKILMPGRFFSDITEYDQTIFEEKYGINLEDFVLYKSMIGDASDNIRGLPGVGPKTAQKIVNTYHTMDSIIANLDELPPRIADAIVENQNLWKDYYKLSKIECDIDLQIPVEDTKVQRLQVYKLRNLIDKYELKTLQKKVAKFIDDFEEKYGMFGLFEEGESLNQKRELMYSLTDKVNFKDSDLIFDSVPGKTAYVLPSSSEQIFKLGNGEDFVEIQAQNLFNFIVTNQIKKFIGFDLKPFIKKLLEGGFEHLENYDFIDLKLAWHLLKHDVALENINELVKQLSEDKYEKLLESTEICLQEENMVSLFNLEKDLQKVLAHMEFIGICCNKEYLCRLQEEFQGKIAELTKQIYDLVGFEFKINSPKELSHVLYNVLHLPQFKKTKTGISTDDSTLAKLEGQSSIIPLIRKYRMYSKANSTYAVGLAESVKPDGKIHTTFSQTIAATGRLSSINPNMQNLPQDEEVGKAIRKAFVPCYSDKLFVSFDYSQIDLRVLAYESKDPELIKAFQNDEDIHTATARLVFDKEEITKQERSFAKTINFGIVYGMEPYGLSQALGVDQKTAKAFIDRYFEKLKYVRKYFDRITKELDSKGYVQTFLGRRRYFPSWKHATGIQKRTLFKEAINMPIQGGSSEVIKLAMVEIFEILNKKQFEASLISQIHDELLFEVNKNQDLEKFKETICAKMEDSFNLGVPLKVSVKEGSDFTFK